MKILSQIINVRHCCSICSVHRKRRKPRSSGRRRISVSYTHLLEISPLHDLRNTQHTAAFFCVQRSVYNDVYLISFTSVSYTHLASGALNGLFRVRTFTQDDAHIFMRPDQIESEVMQLIQFIDRVYSVFGLSYRIELSTRPEKKYIGDLAIWEQSEKALADACVHAGTVSYTHLFSTMDVYLKKRYDLIPNLVKTITGYTKHESETLERVISARNLAVNAQSLDEKIKSEKNFQSMLGPLYAISEQYPNLKACLLYTSRCV